MYLNDITNLKSLENSLNSFPQSPCCNSTMELNECKLSMGQAKVDRVIGYGYFDRTHYNVETIEGLRIEVIRNGKHKGGIFEINSITLSNLSYYRDTNTYRSGSSQFYLSCVCHCGSFSYDTIHEYSYHIHCSELENICIASRLSNINQSYCKDNCKYEITNDLINNKTKVVMLNKSTLELPILDLNIYNPEELIDRAKKLRAFI